MEIKKCWIIIFGNRDGYLLAVDREDAVSKARETLPLSRRRITAIYETFAAIDVYGHFDAIWSDEVPGMNSLEGLPGGESVDAAELADIVENGRVYNVQV